jgi:pimeloyl-ACP methyl ester carboxylesterase
MHTVTSNDGSRIAYDRYGSGPAVILVAGALGYRRFNKMEELAGLLSERLTVINYDRRGRGDSTDVKPFALEREIEDIVAAGDLSAAVKHFMATQSASPHRSWR